MKNGDFPSFFVGLPEGIHLPSQTTGMPRGSFVVRFNQFNTTRSHVQGVGRARAEEGAAWVQPWSSTTG
jgi:hypothetical protein